MCPLHGRARTRGWPSPPVSALPRWAVVRGGHRRRAGAPAAPTRAPVGRGGTVALTGCCVTRRRPCRRPSGWSPAARGRRAGWPCTGDALSPSGVLICLLVVRLPELLLFCHYQNTSEYECSYFFNNIVYERIPRNSLFCNCITASVVFISAPDVTYICAKVVVISVQK